MEITQISSINESSFPDDAFLWSEEIMDSFYEKTNHMMALEERDLLISALDYRIRNRETDYEGEIYDGVMGLYEIKSEGKENIFVELSNDPLHVLLRTTGRQGYSCEQITQYYWKGPFQDFAFRNATAYFYDSDMNWLGRLNTRWCINDEGKVDIGIDPNIYPTMGGWVPGNLIRGLEETKEERRDDRYLSNALWSLLARKGLLYYLKAETPYIYVGHSDTTISGGVKLPFKGLKHYGY